MTNPQKQLSECRCHHHKGDCRYFTEAKPCNCLVKRCFPYCSECRKDVPPAPESPKPAQLAEEPRSARGGVLYKGRYRTEEIEFTRVWAMPSPWTFSIYPISVLLKKYVGDGKNWIDPFAGKFSPAEITNDHNPERKAKFCMEAVDFSRQLTGRYDGVLFDPPYSFRQISENYKVIGKKATQWDTSMSFYEKVKSELCGKIKQGGYAISFGWNTNGFGKTRGFKILEIMNIAHGGSKNDTIVTVEIKL